MKYFWKKSINFPSQILRAPKFEKKEINLTLSLKTFSLLPELIQTITNKLKEEINYFKKSEEKTIFGTWGYLGKQVVFKYLLNINKL